MTSKFEQLIEYVINDEEAKAKEKLKDIRKQYAPPAAPPAL
jgi:hypothetical protein